MRPHSPPYASDAVLHLKRADPILGAIIDRVGPYSVARRRDRFQALIRAIIFQQLAGRAAQTIFDRFVVQVGGRKFPTPAQVLAATDEVLRQVGLSRGKMTYVRDLALHVSEGRLNFNRFAKMEDEAIIADLTRVRGVGRWTAEMFLMFNLYRPDVLPVDDLGVRNAVGRLYAMASAPRPKELREFGERWRPYRTVAAWYLWRSLEAVTPAEADPSPAAATARQPRPAEKARKIAQPAAKSPAKPALPVIKSRLAAKPAAPPARVKSARSAPLKSAVPPYPNGAPIPRSR
ncbi:MAG: DNA-3-methyladenine glycosylase 2 family protein [Candidatus Binataceae bacterium]|nr:DNA-3-methyladenine glycosylase 2 family protein [Candidatus Binataceae bacterium]